MNHLTFLSKSNGNVRPHTYQSARDTPHRGSSGWYHFVERCPLYIKDITILVEVAKKHAMKMPHHGGKIS